MDLQALRNALPRVRHEPNGYLDAKRAMSQPETTTTSIKRPKSAIDALW
jgi:hypothetical protein